MDMKEARARQKGQVLSEYALMMAAFTMAAIVLLMVMSSLTDYGLRLLLLVAFQDSISTG